MPLPVIANVIRTTVSRDDGTGRSAHNVMHFLSLGFDIALLDTALQANVLHDQWLAVWAGYGAITLNYLPLDGTSGTTTVVPTTPANFTGEGGGDLIPQESCIVKLQTGLRGRSHRGRLFLGGIGEDRQNAGAIATATVSAMQAAWDSFLHGMFLANHPLLVASYHLASSDNVSAIQVEHLAGTQRRRMTQLR